MSRLPQFDLTEASHVDDFKRDVGAYMRDNLDYIREETPEPAGEDILAHWDTNGPEGIGPVMSDEHRALFVATAQRYLDEGAYIP